MNPWKVSVGLTVTTLGVVALLGLPELSWLRPHWRVLVRDYSLSVALYGGIAVASYAFSIYAPGPFHWAGGFRPQG